MVHCGPFFNPCVELWTGEPIHRLLGETPRFGLPEKDLESDPALARLLAWSGRGGRLTVNRPDTGPHARAALALTPLQLVATAPVAVGGSRSSLRYEGPLGRTTS